ncbi:sensor histidine kinase [Granulicella arctica]|uniref:histidine kinase n=1 Tax=Granulicella arctica TaxID=940613 RepID=A0A7Y9TGU5_9BACT|nr:ATP-binding protein [Granulicella arctica]NYF80321.1 two-component system sensor histidine kinase KdpD [Granulicella arctica]
MSAVTKSILLASMTKPFVSLQDSLAGKRLLFVAQCAAGILITLLLTVSGLALHLNLSTAGLLYLLLIVYFAVRCGLWQASIISLLAVVCLNYFFAPPTFSFYIADPQNGIAIVIFEITALLVSRVSSREKTYAAEKDLQRRELEQLYAISRGALLLDLHESPERQMAELIMRQFDAKAVAIMNAKNDTLSTTGRWPFPLEPIAERVIRDLVLPDDMPPDLHQRTLVLAEEPIGALLVIGKISPLTMNSLSSLVALTLDRHRAFTSEGVAEAARQTEQLRTTVLDGLAHAFKTPLTIIRAASSGLLEIGHLDELQSQLTVLIDEQSMRLDELASRLLQTARIDGAKICLETETVSVPTLIQEVVQELHREWSERGEGRAVTPLINVVLHNQDLRIVADHDMIASTLKELLDNAAKYSRTGTPIRISASESSKELLISVHSQGPVIQLEDRERIFDRFYRCADHRYSAPGTGIGLSFARRVTEAHAGHIWVISDEQEGTTFNLSLPIHSQNGITIH